MATQYGLTKSGFLTSNRDEVELDRSGYVVMYSYTGRYWACHQYGPVSTVAVLDAVTVLAEVPVVLRAVLPLLRAAELGARDGAQEVLTLLAEQGLGALGAADLMWGEAARNAAAHRFSLVSDGDAPVYYRAYEQAARATAESLTCAASADETTEVDEVDEGFTPDDESSDRAGS